MSDQVETLKSVGERFEAMVRGLEVFNAYKRFQTSRTDDGGAHVELHGRKYAYVVTERGAEYERRETEDPEELLYWLVADTTWAAASSYELKHRVPGQDFRRVMFAKHVELLGKIRPEWGARKRREYEGVLAKHPYNDGRN